MKFLLKSLLITAVLIVVSCSKTSKTEDAKSEEQLPSTEGSEGKGDEKAKETYISPDASTGWDTTSYETLAAQLAAFDFDQDISQKSVEELRFLYNTIPARHGYLFMEADLRGYFSQTPWYKKLMEARWYGDCEQSGVKKAAPISYSDDESAFMNKVKKLEQEKLKTNYIVRDGRKYANVKNIVNAWRYEGLTTEFNKKLDQNGFVITPNTYTQLFHVYEENDYSQTQNFVTTDIYLQLFHMHFSFMLRGIEERYFTKVLAELVDGMVTESAALKQKSTNAPVIDGADYTNAFYVVSKALLGGDVKNNGSKFFSAAKAELTNIEKQNDVPSSLIPAYSPTTQVVFPYSVFKPRGHYTRTDTLKMYFKSMQWLQNASYCLEDKLDLKRALTAAYLLKSGKSKKGHSLLNLYMKILVPTNFLMGEADNVSILDLCNLIEKRGIASIDNLLQDQNVVAIQEELRKILATKNIIKPKIELNCPGKINFMPARFMLDNEIILSMTEIDKRPMPKGLDVMAALGNQTAEDILVKEYREPLKWDKFLPALDKMKTKYKNYENWDATVYSKWISGLKTLLKPDEKYPSFMQLPSWSRKNLNTALASWAELKHDAVLYAERPSAAECGGGGDCEPPPEPYVIGYVEPNVNYWKEALELLAMTEKVLGQYDLLSSDLKSQQEQLKDLCTFLLKVSEKEIARESLTEQEYRTIEIVGSTVEYITLKIFGTDNWQLVSGPDKEIAVVADIYNNNAGPADQRGVLHVAVGNGSDIYVIVEIDGYLYLTKGATFSYFEFPRPIGELMTDEEWQEALKRGDDVPEPLWMKDIILKSKTRLKPKAIPNVYGSGC